MIETDPDDRTPPGRQTVSTAVSPAAADPAAALRVLVQRRQALLQQESAELESLRSYADRLAGLLPAGAAGRPGPLVGIELLTEVFENLTSWLSGMTGTSTI
ncbi:hypothetical protein ACWDA9_32810, partial [Streptomyces sp. NPDC001193]